VGFGEGDIQLKMENAVATEIYGKHDGRLHFSSQIRMRFYQREIFSEQRR
jgi:hypothetical protein